MWYGETLAKAIPLLARFNNLKSLSLRHFTCLVPNTQFNFADQFATSSIVRLELIHFAPTPLSQLCELIVSFPHLKTLLLHSVATRHGEFGWEGGDELLQNLHPSRNLCALELLVPPVSRIMRWLISQEVKPALRSVHLNHIPVFDEEDQHIMGSFLRGLGPTLEFIGWSLGSSFCEFLLSWWTTCLLITQLAAAGTFPPVDMSCNTRLKSILFDLTIDSDNHTTFVLEVLSQITSTQVEQVAFALLGRGHRKHRDTGWAQVDALLAGPRMAALKRLNIHRIRWVFEYTVAWFIERLPRCHARGILCFIDDWPDIFPA
jgi:hypothetical protein